MRKGSAIEHGNIRKKKEENELAKRGRKIPRKLAKRAKQILVLLMDVDGTLTDGSVTLLSQSDGSALEHRRHHRPRQPGTSPAL